MLQLFALTILRVGRPKHPARALWGSLMTSRLSRGAFKLIKYLEAVNRFHGWLRISIDFLRRHFACARSTVLRWIRELKDSQRLTVKRRGPHCAEFEMRPQNETSFAPHLFNESPSGKRASERAAYSDDFGLACAFGVPFDQWTEPDRRAIVSAALASGLPARVAGHIFGGLIRLPRFRGKDLGYAVVAFRGELAAYRAAESGRKPNVSDNQARQQPYFGFERATFEALLAEMPEHQRRALESAA